LKAICCLRLPDVIYETIHFGSTRLLNTRFHAWHSLWLSLRSVDRVHKLPALVKDFAPDAVLTVAHRHLWITAAEFAHRSGLPLHLIVHDDWPRMANLPRPVEHRIDRQFGRVYRSAASRLCVSPSMVQEYRRRYGVPATVLYPARAQDALVFREPPLRVGDIGRKLTFAFAGTINLPDYCRLLRMLARCLEPFGGRLLIFGPMAANEAARVGLNQANIHLCGLLKSNQLKDRLRADADILFVPMSFAAEDQANMQMGFPSKLTDYTAVGLPLLIAGPPYCSAVRWARENPGVAEIVDTDGDQPLAAAIQRLADDPQHRMNLAFAALSIGDRFFSYTAARSKLLGALQSSRAA
jgi:glycosyltransferase involved in cell wall biosynthesis